MALTYNEWLREHPDGRHSEWLSYLRELADAARAANHPALSGDEIHVLLDVIASWRPNPNAAPWSDYDVDPGDLKTSEAGWRALLESAENTLTTMLNTAPQADRKPQ